MALLVSTASRASHRFTAVLYSSYRSSSMAPTTARVYHMVKRFKGEPKLSDFAIKEEVLPPLQSGDILLEAEWLSVDPYMRLHTRQLPEGSKMIGSLIGRVLESRHKDYVNGDHVFGYLGWATHVVCNPDAPVAQEKDKLRKVDLKHLPLSYALGALGMPGCTAYFGMMDNCKPKPGQTLVVTGAAGAVGSVAGQIGKIHGCRVIGFAGSDKKVEWLKKSCKFDVAFNYNKVDAAKALKEAAPNGVDLFYDNVGNDLSSTVISQMNPGGRVCACGAISTYNLDSAKPTLVPSVQLPVVANELTIKGINNFRRAARYPEALKQLQEWVESGQLAANETVYEGFDSLPEAFIDLLRGGNTGKAVVKA